MLVHKTESPIHELALAQLEILGDSDNSAWACIRRIVEVTDLYCRLEESTKPEDFEAFDNWNWEEHHYGVEWRSSWSAEPIDSYRDINWLASDAGVEARITLAGGGPAVRIVADLDGYGSTDEFIVEHCSWWSRWEELTWACDDRLPDYVCDYVFDMVGRYISHVAGWIQEL
jgi:hypothetical protein